MPRKRQHRAVPNHRFNLVIPQSLLEKVEAMAIKNRRSTTAQIICTLEWATREEPDADPKAESAIHVR